MKRVKGIEIAKVMCWECRGWKQHDKIHICPAAKPITLIYPPLEIVRKGDL